MRDPTIAKNYAEALFASGEKTGATERYGRLLEAVAGAIAADDRIKIVLESPNVTKAAKSELMAKALKGKAPESFVRFLTAIVRRGRQALVGPISTQYLALLDIKMDRVHANVVVAREPDEKLKKDIAQRLSKTFGKEVVPHFRTDRAILGGVIVRMGDNVMDGSLRRKLVALRRQMLGG